MKKPPCRPASCLAGISMLLFADVATVHAMGNEWQMRRLMQPSQSELQRERQGQVMIYHGLSDKAVGSALNRHFERIDAMMFTGTVVTDDSGEPLRDPATGEVITEDDDCD